jgi:hypothetical protein
MVGSLLRSSSPRQFPPRPRARVRTPFRGPAGAIDPRDLVPFDATCTRPAVYHEALARVTEYLAACVQELAQLTPPESDLERLSEVLARAQHHLRARHPRAVQLAFPSHTQTPPDGRRQERG